METRERLVGKDVVKETLSLSSDQAAYKVIRDLNRELEARGIKTIRGRVSYRYLIETYFPDGKPGRS